ncbi:MAG: UDP-N-acetylglucosamine 2-epimerase [Faecalibacterium prausnitzii]
MACFYLRIPVGHVGSRTAHLRSGFPYPEEFNRQAVGVLAKYNFAPTEQAKQNLLRKWFSWWAAPRTFPAWHTA